MPEATVAGRYLEVLDPGALSTVQDLGRAGFAHLGVPRSGALDVQALRLGNRLVGNPERSAALETTATGITLRVGGGGRVAVTGAPCDVRVDGRQQPWGAAISCRPGALLQLGPARSGMRTYLAVGGGVLSEVVLGSRSTDLLSGLGPPVLRAGHRLPYGATPAAAPAVEVVVGEPGGQLVLDLGPRADWFTPESVAALDGATYTVAGASNRIGLRLEGMPLERSRSGELATEPMVLGAVQVPPNGQPVVFLADHPTTGGYPVVGVVRRSSLSVCAQARPGDRLSLRVAAGSGGVRGPGSRS